MSDIFKQCPRCGTRTELHTETCTGCGRVYQTRFPTSDERTQLGSAGPTPEPIVAPPVQQPPAYQPPVQPPPAYQHPPRQPASYPPPAQPPPSSYQPQPSFRPPTYPSQGYPPAAPLPPYPLQPPPAYTASAAEKTDICALLSTIFGGLGMLFFCFLGWLFALPGMILGVVSLVRQRRDPTLGGRVLAIVGIALSGVVLAWALFWLVLFTWAALTPTPRSTPAPTSVFLFIRHGGVC